jgi:(5-formylfuran-3-yl)methyl phosphate synthase
LTALTQTISNMSSRLRNYRPDRTQLLVSVRSVDEAATALLGGANIIDIKEPRDGVLGAAPLVVTRAIVKMITGKRPVSATIGDIPVEAAPDAVLATADTGVDYVKIGAFGDLGNVDLTPFERIAALGVRLILVMFADRAPHFGLIPKLRAAGFRGVMLDTAEKAKGTLRTNLDDVALAAFLAEARRVDLLAGLAGSLRVADIAPLLALEPNILGFRGAACKAGIRHETLDLSALSTLRQLIPSVTTVECNTEQHTVAET